MNGANLLQETSAWMDTVDLALCLFIYEVSNDCQFEFASGSDFVNFMNLKPTSRPVAVRPKENLRVCYMVLAVSRTIRPHERGKLWAEEFLKRCGISKSYYDKHRSDVCSGGTTEENREYRKSVDRAIAGGSPLVYKIVQSGLRPKLLNISSMAHCRFMHFPHLLPIMPL